MAPDVEDMQKLLIRIVRELVNNPDAVSVQMMSESPRGIRVLLRVDPPDMRKIVGATGRTADSIRRILNGLGEREGRKYILDIEEAPAAE